MPRYVTDLYTTAVGPLPVATDEELVAFANKVRAVLGSSPIEAVVPSIANAPQMCVIANAVNNGLSVVTLHKNEEERTWPSGSGKWGMKFHGFEAAAKAGEALGLPVQGTLVILPEEIGNAARLFDIHRAPDHWYFRPDIQDA